MKDETHLMFLITSHFFEVNVTCISMTPGFKQDAHNTSHQENAVFSETSPKVTASVTTTTNRKGPVTLSIMSDNQTDKNLK